MALEQARKSLDNEMRTASADPVDFSYQNVKCCIADLNLDSSAFGDVSCRGLSSFRDVCSESEPHVLCTTCIEHKPSHGSGCQLSSLISGYLRCSIGTLKNEPDDGGEMSPLMRIPV